jgi:hypothetical protein
MLIQLMVDFKKAHGGADDKYVWDRILWNRAEVDG